MQCVVGLPVGSESDIEFAVIQQKRRALFLLRSVEFDFAATGLRHAARDYRYRLDLVAVVDGRKTRASERYLGEIDRMQLELPAVVFMPAHNVHRLPRVVDNRGTHDAPFRKIRIPTVESEVFGLGIAQPLCPD